MREMITAPRPTKSDLLALRLMILIGTASLLWFLYCLLDPDNIEHAPLYWLFAGAAVFACLRILHEWYHYLFITVPVPPAGRRRFSVDMLTTYCPGEPYEMIIETLHAMQAVTYPHVSWLCDEADDPYLKTVCRQLGVRHVTRHTRKDAKAGNINHALQYATGELCVVLDPDHVPVPAFLDEVVPFFNDGNVGYVQIVQAYHNIGDSLIAKGAAQQTFQFYGPMMMCMNRYGTVPAIGANCTFRRAALDEIGGHAAGLAEDLHTAMQLHAKGWKSVYLPAVLSYGRVPSTLSAYYRQQLKWARGSLELLVTTYPRLFRQFSWSQRLHYFTVPFHYFSGLFFFVNFLVPMLSLTLGIIPFRMDLLEFTLTGLPFVFAILAIRHFVQRWVMGRGEMGNHVLGGFLLIGTWWIHMLGLVYTVLRKRVPYIPTPKDDVESDNWLLNLPNILVGVLSAGAIAYGLHIDWNPYVWIMAGIAGLNVLVMFCNVAISRQKDFRWLRRNVGVVRRSVVYYRYAKQQFWNFRHTVYAGFRVLAFPFILLVSFATVYFFGNAKRMPSPPVADNARQAVFYTGLYGPGRYAGETDPAEVDRIQRSSGAQLDIVSLYIPWGDQARCDIPQHIVQAIYRNGSLPLITWEPWMSLFRDTAGAGFHSEKRVFARVVEGRFDDYLQRFARALKALNRPVYLRFAHEPDNPAYPWSATGENTADDFKKAWQYVHRLFIHERAYNVIWVWNPWKPAAVERYWPGGAYVDWLGVTCLNYGAASFSEIYEPFHLKPVFRSGLPVMVAEAGTLGGNGTQWMNAAYAASALRYPEIRAMVLFNTGDDRNVPEGWHVSTIDWRLNDPAGFFRGVRKKRPAGERLVPAQLHYLRSAADEHEAPAWLDTVRGVNYEKGGNWFRNLHTLTRREVVRDFREMRAMGINTIRRNGPGIYDRNIFAAAGQTGMHVHYGFWLPLITDAHADEDRLKEEAHAILSTVRRLKQEKQITAWCITNTSFPLLQRRYYKPAYLYQQKAYAAWLRRLVDGIKTVDPARPVLLDVQAGEDLPAFVQYLHDEVPAADAFGLAVQEDGNGLAQPPVLPAGTFFSAVPATYYRHYRELHGNKEGVFIASWQDQGAAHNLSFNGLLDHEGKYKPDFYVLQGLWERSVRPDQLPAVKILRPALSTEDNRRLVYRAVVRERDQWKLAAKGTNGLRFEWYLIRRDRKGTPVMMKRLGAGTEMAVTTPFNPAAFRLYLRAVRGNSVITAQSALNTPL